MSAGQQIPMQPDVGPRRDDGDTASCSTDTSMWSAPSRLRRGSDQLLTDLEDFLAEEKQPPATSPGSKQFGFKKVYKQKIYHHKLKLPPIKTVQVSRVQSASMNFIKELRSQMWDLQQQLGEARSENKLLKQVQHRHTVALQHFQHSEGTIGQILAKHNSETGALQKLLRETRICRDNLSRQLQATESKLLTTKAALQHLRQLSQDQNLLEREELALRLAKATAELEDRDNRMQDMERNLELCQVSFKRQIVTEQRKVKEARNMCLFLQEHIHQLTADIQEKEKEIERHNIYIHRFLKASKKGTENKMVQTDGFVNIPTNILSLLEMEYFESEDMLGQQGTFENWPCNNQKREFLVTENPETKIFVGHERVLKDAKMCAGFSVLFNDHTSENYLEESPERTPKHQSQHDFFTEREISEAQLDGKQQTLETSVACISEKSLNATQAKKRRSKLQNTRHNHTFRQSIEKLHNGLSAYSDTDTSLPAITKGKVELLSRGVQDLCLLGGKSGRGEGDKSQHKSQESSTDLQTHKELK